jgi:hypothetical protein
VRPRILLSVDASTTRLFLSVCYVYNVSEFLLTEKIVFNTSYQSDNTPIAPVSDLLSYIETFIELHGFFKSDLCGIIVGSGYGSYTGIRSAFSVCKALCYGLKIPLIEIRSDFASALAYSYELNKLEFSEKQCEKKITVSNSIGVVIPQTKQLCSISFFDLKNIDSQKFQQQAIQAYFIKYEDLPDYINNGYRLEQGTGSQDIFFCTSSYWSEKSSCYFSSIEKLHKGDQSISEALIQAYSISPKSFSINYEPCITNIMYSTATNFVTLEERQKKWN